MNFSYLNDADRENFLELERIIIAEAIRLEEETKKATTPQLTAGTSTPVVAPNFNFQTEEAEYNFLDQEVERISEEIRREEAEKAATAMVDQQGASNFIFNSEAEEYDFLDREVERISEEIRREEAEKAAAVTTAITSQRATPPFWQGNFMSDSESDALWTEIVGAQEQQTAPQLDLAPSSSHIADPQDSSVIDESESEALWRELVGAPSSPSHLSSWPQGSPIASGMTDSQEKSLWDELMKIYNESGKLNSFSV